MSLSVSVVLTRRRQETFWLGGVRGGGVVIFVTIKKRFILLGAEASTGDQQSDLQLLF